MDVDLGVARGLQGVAPFLKRLQPHVRQDRQDVGQRHGRTPAVQFEAEVQRAVGRVAEGAHGHRFTGPDLARGVQGVDGLVVGDGLGRGVAVAIAGPEGVGPAGADRADRDLVHVGGAQGAFETVDPAATRLGDLGVQRGLIRARMIAGGHADDVVDADQRLIRQLRIPGRHPAAPRAGQDGADPFTDRGVETLTRDEGQDRDEAVERILAGEGLDPRAVVQVQDAQGDLEQLVLGDLEEFVARIVLEDVLQPLVAVRAFQLARAGQGVGHLAADQRHFRRGLVIGLGGEQADEAGLARGAAVGAEALDPDVVHVGPAVDARADVGLGDRDRLGQVQLALHLLGQDRRFGGAAQHSALRVRQHAQADAGLGQGRLGLVAAVLAARIVVVTGAEEDEMVRRQPAQEFEVLGQDFGVDAGGRGLEVGDRTGDQLVHGGVVGHRCAHIGQGLGHGLAQGVAALLRQGVDDDDDHRDAAGRPLDDRVVHRTHGDAGLGQLAHDAVDQEGLVVLDDGQDVIAGGRARGAGVRPDADAGRGRRIALGDRTPHRGQQSGEVGAVQLRRLVCGVVLQHLGQVGLLSRAGRMTVRGCEIRLQRLQVDRLRERGGGGAGHGQVSYGAARAGRRFQKAD
jgi:hypothetical protein